MATNVDDSSAKIVRKRSISIVLSSEISANKKSAGWFRRHYTRIRKIVAANYQCLSPIITCGSVFIMALAVQAHLIAGSSWLSFPSLPAITFASAPVLDHPSMRELSAINSARIIWVAASFLHVILCIFAVGGGMTLVIWGPLSILHACNRAQRLVITIVILFIAATLGGVVVHNLSQAINVQLLSVIARYEQNGEIVGNLVDILNWLTFTTSIFLILLSSLVLFQPRTFARALAGTAMTTSENNRSEKELWESDRLEKILPEENHDDGDKGDIEINELCQYMSEQSRECRIIFYLGTAVLVSAILRLHSFFGWGLSYYLREDASNLNGFRSLLETLASAWGIYAMMLLLAMFFPTFVLLNLRAFQLARRYIPEATHVERKKWIEDRGLALSNLQYLSKSVAIVSPFLIGKLSEIVKHV